MSIQRAYPRLIGGVPSKDVMAVPYVGVMEMQKILNQMCDWIFQGGGGSSSGGGSVIEAISLTDLVLGHSQQTVPDTEIALTAGTWVLIGNICFETTATSGFGFGFLTITGQFKGDNNAIIFSGVTGGTSRNTVSQTWTITTSGCSAKLQAAETLVGVGGRTIAGSTKLTAIRV